MKHTTPEMVTKVPRMSSRTKGRKWKTWLKTAFAGSAELARTTTARLTEPEIKPTKEKIPKMVEPTTPMVCRLLLYFVCSPSFAARLWSAEDNKQLKKPIPSPAKAELTMHIVALKVPPRSPCSSVSSKGIIPTISG